MELEFHQTKPHNFRGEAFKDSRDLRKYEKEMYILPEEIKNLGLNDDSAE
ncbi:hypothetical protein [Rhodohalobacter sp. 614A]|nr:hypothetical protein [Rhodohalobacter sp. 614A]